MAQIDLVLPRPHPAQKKMIDSPARFKVMRCGRRFGKTKLSVLMLLISALKKKGLYWYVSPTYTQSKNIAWTMILDMARPIIKKKNEQELSIVLVNGSQLFLKGVDNEDGLRGVGLDGVICDEYDDWRAGIFDTILKPALMDKRGWAWFLGTPKGYSNLYEFTELAKTTEGWEAFHFTSYDNPFIDHEEIEYTKRTTDKKYFAQEIMAEFTTFTGLVYHEFSRDLHVSEFDIPANAIHFRGLDFGADHPTACVWFCIDTKGDIWFYDEYKNTGDFDQHVSEIKSKTKHHINITWCDPSAKQAILEFNKRGIYCVPGINDREVGISLFNSKFREGKVHISSKCTQFIYELEHHRYRNIKEGKLRKDGDVEKVNDDACDAARYALCSYYAPKEKVDHIQAKIDKINKKPRIGLITQI